MLWSLGDRVEPLRRLSGDSRPTNDLNAVRDCALGLAHRAGGVVQELGMVDGLPITAIRFPALQGVQPVKRILVNANIHGDEKSSSLAALQMMDRLSSDQRLRRTTEYVFVPVSNPVGFVRHTRNNGDDLDLNREATEHSRTPEMRALRRVLDDGRFMLALDLHSAPSLFRGSVATGHFALFQDKRGRQLLERVMPAFAKTHPVMRGDNEIYAVCGDGIYASTNKGTIKDYMTRRGACAITLEGFEGVPYQNRATATADLGIALVKAALEPARAWVAPTVDVFDRGAMWG